MLGRRVFGIRTSLQQTRPTRISQRYDMTALVESGVVVVVCYVYGLDVMALAVVEVSCGRRGSWYVMQPRIGPR